MALKKPILSPAAAAASRRMARRLEKEREAASPDERNPKTPARRSPPGPIQKPATPRRRIQDETRTQMLNRLTNPQISLYEASVILEVCAATVRRYSDSGELPHARTPGGQRRFYLRDVLALARERGSLNH